MARAGRLVQWRQFRGSDIVGGNLHLTDQGSDAWTGRSDAPALFQVQSRSPTIASLFAHSAFARSGSTA